MDLGVDRPFIETQGMGEFSPCRIVRPPRSSRLINRAGIFHQECCGKWVHQFASSIKGPPTLQSVEPTPLFPTLNSIYVLPMINHLYSIPALDPLFMIPIQNHLYVSPILNPLFCDSYPKSYLSLLAGLDHLEFGVYTSLT